MSQSNPPVVRACVPTWLRPPTGPRWTPLSFTPAAGPPQVAVYAFGEERAALPLAGWLTRAREYVDLGELDRTYLAGHEVAPAVLLAGRVVAAVDLARDGVVLVGLAPAEPAGRAA